MYVVTKCTLSWMYKGTGRPGFGIAYNFLIECSSEYTVGVPQSSTKEG